MLSQTHLIKDCIGSRVSHDRQLTILQRISLFFIFVDFLTLIYLFIFSVGKITCFKTFSALNSIVFTNIPSPKDNVHSEYYFGKCTTRYKKLFLHDHYTADEIQGAIIVRGHLNVTDEIRRPNCVYIRATSAVSDMVRYQAYKFALCFARIVHNYSGEIFEYNYYEWFLPVEIQDGIEWDIFFYEVL
ncbi:uncharacterized protein LOC124643642 [Helicoverpa zea]|uniref:uncharacterized protein LOC124643642 n=1 Tax=Helicoverpa zea TaxID=7113 RepID=UPI001F59D09A|nr:uncharacterized protein LOC124643642 [Helicoverpa zea]